MRKKQIPPKFKMIIPYFGAKSRIVGNYPEPVYDTIVEPFAGGASYSLYYYDRDVILNDVFEPLVAVWKFLLSPDAIHWVRERIPWSLKMGTTMEDIQKDGDPEGLTWLMRSAFACGSFGQKGIRTKVSPLGAYTWAGEDIDGVVRSGASRCAGFRERLEYWIPRIAHWKIKSNDYSQLPNRFATWFIDPPYANAAGATYAHGAKGIDFVDLGNWCKSREGQVIVCENSGADWLPFEPLLAKRVGIYASTIKSEVGEVLYHRCDTEQIGLWS